MLRANSVCVHVCVRVWVYTVALPMVTHTVLRTTLVETVVNVAGGKLLRTEKDWSEDILTSSPLRIIPWRPCLLGFVLWIISLIILLVIIFPQVSLLNFTGISTAGTKVRSWSRLHSLACQIHPPSLCTNISACYVMKATLDRKPISLYCRWNCGESRDNCTINIFVDAQMFLFTLLNTLDVKHARFVLFCRIMLVKAFHLFFFFFFYLFICGEKNILSGSFKWLFNSCKKYKRHHICSTLWIVGVKFNITDNISLATTCL